MDLAFNQEEQAFRDEVRAFLRDKLPADMRRRVHLGDHSHIKEDIEGWQKILNEHGWGAPAWPVEFGGTGWSKARQFIFETECALADAPAQLAFGVKMVAPVIMRFGSAEQQKHYLPRILAAKDWWCQGYSEPGSGSDLASLKTKAELDGDHYVVNGQKVWNTLGQYADWIFCLVRTDSSGKPQRGISFLLIDMKTPGISVRPTRLLDGSYEVNEIWFDNVRVPVANRIGDENAGWTYAKYLLGHERTNIAGIGVSQRELRRLRHMASTNLRHDKPLIEDALFATRIAQVELELKALEITNLRVIFAEEKQQAPGPEASILKIRGTEIMQRITELQVEALGARGLIADAAGQELGEEIPRATETYLNQRKLTIFGGSNEIQRNIIAQMILQV
jgi:alkylation response protein AidB-like acyl-CoA dehydrogenase